MVSDIRSTMIADTQPSQLLAPIRPVLTRLRRWIRLYVLARGLLIAAIWVAGAFWLSYTFDRLLEPEAFCRGVIAATIVAAVGWALVRWMLAPMLAPLADSQLALLVERRFPHFGERLLTAVELHGRWEEMGPWARRMFAQTCRLAAEPICQVRLGGLFRWKPLLVGGLAAGMLSASTAGFVVAHRNDAALWFQRWVLMRPVQWPRRTRLVVLGCQTGPLRVARGSDAKLVVRADLRMPLVPQLVRVRWRAGSGKTQQVVMTREGNADRAHEVYQHFSHTFRNVLAPIELDVRGGDVVLRGLRIEPVDRPVLTRLVLDCRYPEYTGRGRQLVTVVGPVRLPVGTRVGLYGVANKPLVWLAVGSRENPTVQFHPAAASVQRLLAEQLRLYEWAVGNLADSGWIAQQWELAGRALELAGEIAQLHSSPAATQPGSGDPPGQPDDTAAQIEQAARWMRQAAAFCDRPGASGAASGVGKSSGRNAAVALAAGIVQASSCSPFGMDSGDASQPDLAGPADWVVCMELAIEQLQRVAEQVSLRHSFQEFSDELGTLDGDRVLVLEMRDAEGIAGGQPVEVALSAQPDQPPEVSVRLAGIGSAVTPKARVPISGRVRDDWGLASIWLEQAVEGDEADPDADAIRTPIGMPATNPSQYELATALDLAEQRLEPGRVLRLAVAAEDRCALAGGPNQARSERWQLEIVTAERLRAMLEARELMLRQRLEQIVGEVQQSRDLLVRVRDGDPQGQAQSPLGDESGENGADVPLPEAASGSSSISLDGAARRRVDIQRAWQNAEKNAHETAALVEAIEQVRMEYVNNRIDSPELVERFDAGLIAPLRQVVDRGFPQLRQGVEQLRNVPTSRQAADAAVGRADAVLQSLRAVLAHMMKLEDFNKLIEQLRGIINAQQQLRRQTGERQDRQLQDLLEVAP